MGPWGTLTRVIAAIVIMPAAVVTASRLPWNVALIPVWGSIVAGALTGVIGAATENYVAVRLNALARFVLWTGLAALLLWLGNTYVPGFRLFFWAGTTASLATGLAESLLPASVMER